MNIKTFISNIILIVTLIVICSFPVQAEEVIGVGPGESEEYCVDGIEQCNIEYPVAQQIWDYLHEQGFNDWVAAGILGNIMNEAGGNTLDINVSALSKHKTYYGICQWSHKYYPEVWYQDLNYQLDYLMSTIEKEFSNFGKCYYRGFSYSDFMNLTDEKEAALAFSKVYERNYSSSYSARKRNATKAYEYFVSR